MQCASTAGLWLPCHMWLLQQSSSGCAVADMVTGALCRLRGRQCDGHGKRGVLLHGRFAAHCKLGGVPTREVSVQPLGFGPQGYCTVTGLERRIWHLPPKYHRPFYSALLGWCTICNQGGHFSSRRFVRGNIMVCATSSTSPHCLHCLVHWCFSGCAAMLLQCIYEVLIVRLRAPRSAVECSRGFLCACMLMGQL